MSNVLVTCNLIAKETLAILENTLGFAANVNRNWEDEFAGNQSKGYSPGATINIKRPPRYTYRAGRTAVPQATTETSTALTVNQGGTDLGFTGFERTLSLQQFEQKMAAAAATVANEVDRQGLQVAHDNVYNLINAAGAIPATSLAALQIYTDTGARLDAMGAPRDRQRAMILNPKMNGASVAGLAGLFNSADKLNRQYGSGMMVDSLGYIVAMDQNSVGHANGAGTASNVNGANQTGSSVTVAATGAGTITKGTIITLPGVFAVNPQSRQSTGELANFIITADVAVGATSLPISPAIVTSGAFQNVTASPTTGSPFVIQGAASTTYGASYAYHKDAFTLAMVPMYTPPGNKGVVDISQLSHNGFTVKAVTYYDGVSDTYNTRLDVLFGWAAVYAELGCRIHNV